MQKRCVNNANESEDAFALLFQWIGGKAIGLRLKHLQWFGAVV
jgi:hypothetical protein